LNFIFDGVSLQNGRSCNMDSLLMKSRLVAGENALLAVVCDGVGSLAEGAFASGTAVVKLGQWFDQLQSTNRVGLIMRDAILDINSYIVMEAGSKNYDTASTLSVMLLVESDFYIVHIGDSRIYSYGDDGLMTLTGDDISQTGKLTGYIGKSDDIFLQYHEGPASGKVFLLCSDGLYKMMDESFMVSKMRNLNKRSMKETIKTLPQYVITRGERDNITFALVLCQT